jgi:hypothetical protein
MHLNLGARVNGHDVNQMGRFRFLVREKTLLSCCHYYEDYFYVDNEDDSDGRAQNVGREDMTHEQGYWFQLANIETSLSSTCPQLNKKEHEGKGLHFCGMELWISKDCKAKSMKFSEDPTMKVKENVMKHNEMSGIMGRL